MAGTFIGYRRDDSAGYAGRLHEALERRFGPGRVFRDVDTLRPGDHFVRAIEQRLARCRVFLVLIGREWLEARDGSGRRRLDQEEDYVRLEIATALKRSDVVIMPVLVEGAAMPAARDLPEEIRNVAYLHALSLRDETWDADVDRLATLIAQHDGGQPVPVAARRSRLPLLALGAAAIVVAIFAVANSRDAEPDASDASEAPVVESATAARAPAREAPGGRSAAEAGPARSEAAYAIRMPRVAEVAYGPFIYTLLAGSVAPKGAADELRLLVRASNEGRYDAILADASFRLLTGGNVLLATSGVTRILAGQAVDRVVVTFDIPRGTDAATVRILGVEPHAEVPLDLTSTGRPPEDERASAGDALSRAIVSSLQRDPVPFLSGAGYATTLRSATARRFANAVRLTFSIGFSNTGQYAAITGGLVLRVAFDDRVIPPWEAPNEIIHPASTVSGNYVFDVPPATQRIVLRGMIGTTSTERAFDIP